MKPEIKISPEQVSSISKEALSIDSLKSSLDDLEKTPEGVAEKSQERSELGARASDVALTTTIPQPVNDDADDVTSTTDEIIGLPTVAGDDDLIEKEWVIKAKKIVSETRDDPHKREEVVSKLHVAYLKERFGREIGHSGS